MWLIRAKTETDETTGQPLYWSNEDGWVDRMSATVFTAAEKRILRLPIDGEWVEVE